MLYYYLVVPAERWPTFGQVCAALAEDRSPVKLVNVSDATKKYGFTDDRHVLDVTCDCVHIGLGAQIQILDLADFTLLEDTWQPEYSNPIVGRFKEWNLPIQQSDIVVQIYNEISPYDWGPWWLLAATFVRHFGGSFYDPQSDELWDLDTLVANGHQFRNELNAYRSKYISV
jgi:hypothetical protein